MYCLLGLIGKIINLARPIATLAHGRPNSIITLRAWYSIDNVKGPFVTHSVNIVHDPCLDITTIMDCWGPMKIPNLFIGFLGSEPIINSEYDGVRATSEEAVAR